MLPLIDLRLTALASPFQNPFTGEWACNGHAVALRMERLRERSEALSLNLDRFLSHQLARGFSLNHVKRPILVWFGMRFDCAILTFSDKLDRYYPNWAHEIPSYFEEGREAISDISRPYAYWSGLNLHRIYPADSMLPFVDEDGMPRETDDGMEYVCDFGAATGWLVGPSYPDIAEHIRSGGEDTWEYSIVPREPQEIVQVGDIRCVLLHSRYNFTA